MTHTQLTDHFNSAEFFVSAQYPDIAHAMEVRPEILKNLYLWCYLIGEPVRKQFGPVVIHSGYRDDQLNSVIGGAQYSQHTRGLAADFTCPQAESQPKVHMWIVDHLGDSFSQCFYYPKKGHSHVGCPELGILRHVGFL